MIGGNHHPEIVPRGKPFITLAVKIVLFVLGRGFQSIAIHDGEVRKEIESWEESFSVLFEVLPGGPYLLLQKRNSKLTLMGFSKAEADLVVCFKNLESAFMILSGQMGTPQGYAEHRMSVKGDLALAMSLIRCLNLVEFYLFPGFMARKILKRLPTMTLRKFGLRLHVYFLGIPFGI
jgi:hypothetical protein